MKNEYLNENHFILTCHLEGVQMHFTKCVYECARVRCCCYWPRDWSSAPIWLWRPNLRITHTHIHTTHTQWFVKVLGGNAVVTPGNALSANLAKMFSLSIISSLPRWKVTNCIHFAWVYSTFYAGFRSGNEHTEWDLLFTNCGTKIMTVKMFYRAMLKCQSDLFILPSA